MLARLADFALERPRTTLGLNLAALAVAVAVAAGAPGELAVGSLSLGDDSDEPDLVLATRGDVPVSSRVYTVALETIESQLLADDAVQQVGRAGVSRDGRATALAVFLAEGDAGDRLEAIRRIEAAIDPGTLRMHAGGEARALDDARTELAGELWRLELLAAPFALLVLAAGFGARLALGPILAAGLAIAGALAGLSLLDGLVDVSLLAIAPAAVVGLALGIELPAMVVARYREEAVLAEADEAARRALSYGGPGVVLVAAVAAVIPLALLVTPLDQAPSIAIACALASLLALAVALTAVPALIALATRAGHQPASMPRSTDASRGARLLGFAPAFLAHSRVRAGVGCLIAVALLAAAAIPALDGVSRPFAASDLPEDTEASRAAALTADLRPASRGEGKNVAAATEGDDLFDELPPAAGLALALSALALLAATRSLWGVPLAIAALLPAAAAAGLLVFVFQEGHLASSIGQDRQGVLDGGALATALAALAAIAAARCAGAAWVARGERRLGMPAEAAAETAAPLVIPAAIAGTLVTAVAAGVLAGSDLIAAREFGLAVAIGLLLDLIVVRIPFLATAARWGGR